MKHFQTGGEDTAHVSLYVEWKTPDFYRATIEWKAAQEIGRNGHPDPLDERITGFTLRQYHFDVQPFGFNAGDSRYSYFPYVLKCDGIRYCFAERPYTGEDMRCPNVRVEMGSVALMLLGLHECWRRAREVIRLLGGTIRKNRVARVDVCVDLPGVSVETMQKAVWQGRMVSRAKYKAQYAVLSGSTEELDTMRIEEYRSGRKKTGVVIGRSLISCRIYDKLHESFHNEEKLSCLQHMRWGGELPEQAARVEFQLRAEALRKLTVEGVKSGIESVEDWLLCRAQVCKYLCRSWLRVYRKDFDASHTGRLDDNDLLPAWQRVIAAFECWTGAEEAKKVTRDTAPLRLDAFSLIREGFGCIRAAFIRCGIHFRRENPEWMKDFCRLTARAFKRLAETDGHARFFQRQRDAENKLDAALPWNPVSMIL